MRAPWRSIAFLILVGCGGKTTNDPEVAASASAAATSPTAGATAAGASAAATGTAAPASSVGPVVAIPAGKLVAGTPCGEHPRLPSEELSGVDTDLGAYDIDAYPYPNDPDAPAKTNVDQEQAAALCKARGRRLCTELEWEHACKGPKNTKYEYGDRFDAKACSAGAGTTANGGKVGALDKCVSGFGVRAMHGFVFERTASSWERDANPTWTVARGGFGNQPFAHQRCTAVKMVQKETPDADLGFRCCGGPENGATVKMERDTRPNLEPIEPIEPALAARIGGALERAHLKVGDGSGEVLAAWRWRPVGHEELVLAKVAAAGDAGARPSLVAVTELCERTAQVSNRVHTAFDEIGAPTAREEKRPGSSAGEPPRYLVEFPVKRGDTADKVTIEYQFGQVVVTEPK